MPNSAANSLPAHYDALVASGLIERDPAQLALVRRLEALACQLQEQALASKRSALGWLFARRKPCLLYTSDAADE